MFYQFCPWRTKLREFWWSSVANKLFIWVALIIKLFRLCPRVSTDDLAVESLRPFESDASKVPPDVLARFSPVMSELDRLGFRQPVWHEQDDVYQGTHNTLATLVHSSGDAFVRVQCRSSVATSRPKVKFFTTFVSKPAAGGFIVTTNGTPDLAWPSEHRVSRAVGLPVGQLWGKHRLALFGQSPAAIRDRSALIEAAEAYHVSLRDFHVRRGVFVPVAQDNVSLGATAPGPGTVVPPATADLAAAPPADLMEAATLTELERIQRKTAGWGPAIVLLIISLLAFVGMSGQGGERWHLDWQYLLIVIPVVFFHELGHLLAMRLFGYRNLRMFFIPLFGAAATGRNYTAPGWKKAVVSLMGPVPGILAGMALTVSGVLLKVPVLTAIGVVAAFLNGLNLLPILPLDGGWIAHTVLFCRHRMLEVVFHFTAAAALIAAGILAPGGTVFLLLGILMLLSLPASYKLAKVVGELRKEGFLYASPDSSTVPTEVARTILSRLRQEFKRLTPGVAARQTLSVYETLNARPPGVLASFGIAAAHGASLVLAVATLVAPLWMLGLRPWGMGATLGSWEPRRVLDPNSITTAGQVEPATGYSTMIMHFANGEAARAAWPAARAMAGERVQATLLGETVLLSFPDHLDIEGECRSRWAKQAKGIFRERPDAQSCLVVRCVAPDEQTAEAIETEAGRCYFPYAHVMPLMPPWAAPTDWPADRRGPQTEARLLLAKLQAPWDQTIDPQGRQRIETDLSEAYAGRDTEKIARLEKEYKDQAGKWRRQYRDKIKAEHGDHPVISAWERVEELGEENPERYWEVMDRELGPLLGLWPREKPSGHLAQSGSVFAEKGGTLTLQATFGHVDAGATAVVLWLRSQGCRDFKYDIWAYQQ